MSDLFQDKADDWDTRPIPAQISEGVFASLHEHVALTEDLRVMDFGAGTGLVCAQIAPHVERVLAVDISRAMLDKLAAKPELAGKVEIHCQNIVDEPLGATVDLVVSAMAMHHVEDTRALLRSLNDHLAPGGRVALADLDAEDGSFHPPDTEGVFHAGFDREALGELLADAGFADVRFVTACEVHKGERAYPIFLVTATKA
ncbi:MAG: methyltransferase domain-containing protein [Myxococcales bacterium]|nr:methyltransferase domain-containing protein [Myxococcales bacterium]